jgi:hypothetical protein
MTLVSLACRAAQLLVYRRHGAASRQRHRRFGDVKWPLDARHPKIVNSFLCIHPPAPVGDPAMRLQEACTNQGVSILAWLSRLE